MSRLSPFFPAMVVVFGALVVAAGGFWASWRQSNFNIDLREKNEEIARLQHENASLITGDDSFAYAAFQIFDIDGTAVDAHAMPNNLLLAPVIIAKGEYPLYDVTVRFVDFREPVTNNSALTGYQIGNIAPGLATLTPIRLPHHGKDLKFNIFFSARNGLWVQSLRMPWVGDGWGLANKVMRGSQEIYREVSANFPRGQDGSVDWERQQPRMRRVAARHGAALAILDWRERLVCSQCGSRVVEFVVTGTERR
jgi:hypothetical protein